MWLCNIEQWNVVFEHFPDFVPFFPLIIYAVLELLIVTINVVNKFPINPEKFKSSRAMYKLNNI